MLELSLRRRVGVRFRAREWAHERPPARKTGGGTVNFQSFDERFYLFCSRIDRERQFLTHGEARQYDRNLAKRIVANTTPADFEAAFKSRNDRLAKALMFLAEETDLFALEAAEAC